MTNHPIRPVTDRPESPAAGPASRLAPSPTGALHLGNARTFLINWALARQNDWHLPLRIEDLDSPRVKPESIDQTIDLLTWLGLDFDGPITRQSLDLEPYRQAMRTLADQEATFSCPLTRSDIEASLSAPHRGDHELVYPHKLRPDPARQPERFRFEEETTNHRFLVPDRQVIVEDQIMGRVETCPASEVGDFVVWTKRGLPAYQLAVVVDDHRQGVTDVVRGDDLLPSAGRQTLLYERLGWTPPRWWHLPLVLGPDGRRLAKRHGDTRVSHYREEGVPAERVIGLLAYWSSASDEREAMSATEFAQRFELQRLPREAIVFTDEDDRWLLGDD